MKRTAVRIVVVVAVGIISWAMGMASGRGFEFNVEVSDAGVRLVSKSGCDWDSASYSGDERGSYVFVVSESGVRTPGAEQ